MNKTKAALCILMVLILITTVVVLMKGDYEYFQHLPIVHKAHLTCIPRPLMELTETPLPTPTFTSPPTPSDTPWPITPTVTTIPTVILIPIVDLISVEIQCIQPKHILTTKRVYDTATHTYIQYTSSFIPCIPPGGSTENGILYNRVQWNVTGRFRALQ